MRAIGLTAALLSILAAAAAAQTTVPFGTSRHDASQPVEVTSDRLDLDMQGDVLLTQGSNALSGDRLAIDLSANTARMEGRVRTLFVPRSGSAARP